MRVVWTALCCYFDDWLYVFPQLRLKLVYGDAIVKEAIPDFTVMDVMSFLRMAVVEDKRHDDELKNSEPQLIAELIALFQANADDTDKKGSLKREAHEPYIMGVRVNGLRFWLYHIDNPNHLLASLASNSAASDVTEVKKLGHEMNGLDFLQPEDRAYHYQDPGHYL